MTPISHIRRNGALDRAIHENGHRLIKARPSFMAPGSRPAREVPPTAQAMLEWLKPVEDDPHGTISQVVMDDDAQFEGMSPLDNVLQINPRRLEFAAKYLTHTELLYLEEHIRDSFRAQCRACEKAICTKEDCHSAHAREACPDLLLEFCLGSNVKVLTSVPVDPKQTLISDWTIDVQCRVPFGIRLRDAESDMVNGLNADIARATKIARAAQNRLRSDADWYNTLMDIVEKASADRSHKTMGDVASTIKTFDDQLIASRKSELPF